MKVSGSPGDVLYTYSLGSCIGVSIYDPVVKVGGLLHLMLPDSNLDPAKARKNPYMFADTGLPALFKTAYQYDAKKERMRVIVVGGSQVLDQKGFFNIGKRNILAVKKILHRNNVVVDFTDVGGNVNRTLKLAVNDGETRLKVSGQGEKAI